MDSKFIHFTIDGKECIGDSGDFILEAAKKNGIYIPSLCNYEGVPPRGSCRICTVLVNGKMMTACTTRVTEGMKIETETEELNDLRKAVIEILFVEGNHLCPACEKSGSCELQALAYRFNMDVPRFPYQFPDRDVEATNPKIIKDHNRCILCKRCIRGVKDEQGRSYFAFRKRGYEVEITIDTELANKMSDDLAQKAMDMCPVGAILRRGIGFSQPIGSRKFDKEPIGSDV
ncbi:MAG: 2Fe-2S iron-sulfur cluster-binding protein [Spirochaetes bacterium]|nr:2Fe-2S iron-sulfur cluster-binding protein [Spirochaetota bacterium]